MARIQNQLEEQGKVFETKKIARLEADERVKEETERYNENVRKVEEKRVVCNFKVSKSELIIYSCYSAKRT